MQVSFILCMYNEIQRAPAALADLIQELENHKDEEIEILMLDNCSDDGTREWLQELDDPRIKVILNETNLGKGGSIKKAIKLSTGECVIIHDPDGEYMAKDIWPVLNKMRRQKAGMGLGSRLKKGRVTTQYLANYIGVVGLNTATNWLYGTRLSDTATALKIFNGPLVRRLKLVSNGFNLDFELVVRVARSGYEIIEEQVDYYPRTKEEGKKIRTSDGFKAMWVIIRDRFIPKSSIISPEETPLLED